MTPFNLFRILGDCMHLLSKCILIFAIHRNRSAEGVSLITQVLYAVVFCTRYLDLFRERYLWNLFFKIFYITSSIYIIVVMRWVYPRTREKEMAWKMGAIATAGALVLSPFAMLIFDGKVDWGIRSWLWEFSEILESVCILPQLLLLRQTTVPTVIDSFYLLALGSYRAFYLANWFKRGLDPNDRPPNGVSVTFGILQTLFYIDFAWVYYTRQRVKLRNGGIVDADDIRRGWLLNRIFGKHLDQDAGDEESAPALGGNVGSRGRAKWGSRGISVSADDTTLEHEQRADGDHNIDGSVDPDAKMKDPDELALALDEDDDEDGTLPGASSRGGPSGVRNDEWDE